MIFNHHSTITIPYCLLPPTSYLLITCLLHTTYHSLLLPTTHYPLPTNSAFAVLLPNWRFPPLSPMIYPPNPLPQSPLPHTHPRLRNSAFSHAHPKTCPGPGNGARVKTSPKRVKIKKKKMKKKKKKKGGGGGKGKNKS